MREIHNKKKRRQKTIRIISSSQCFHPLQRLVFFSYSFAATTNIVALRRIFRFPNPSHRPFSLPRFLIIFFSFTLELLRNRHEKVRKKRVHAKEEKVLNRKIFVLTKSVCGRVGRKVSVDFRSLINHGSAKNSNEFREFKI